MIFLTLAYLLHTMGELCLSPVGLSYISKLAPARLLGLMFGVWFVNAAIANKIAGMTARTSTRSRRRTRCPPSSSSSPSSPRAPACC